MKGDGISDFHVASEVGALRGVLLHRPDLSLQRLTPSNRHRFLFDEVLWVRRAREDHDAFADSDERYPTVALGDLDDAGLDLVLLPDEPYVFTADDGPEAFRRTPTRLVSGRLLTWYGPSLVEAHRALADLVSP